MIFHTFHCIKTDLSTQSMSLTTQLSEKVFINEDALYQRFSTGGSGPQNGLRSCLDWVVVSWAISLHCFVISIQECQEFIYYTWWKVGHRFYLCGVNLVGDFTMRKRTWVLSKATSKVKLPRTFNWRRKSVNNIHCNILSLLRFDLYIQLSCAFRFLNLICSF